MTTITHTPRATDQDLIKEARELSRLGRTSRTHDQKRRLVMIHQELEERYPSIAPVLDRWAASSAPMATYTETLIGALPLGVQGGA